VDSTGALYVAGTVAPDMPILFAPPPLSVWESLAVTTGAFQTASGSKFVLKLNANASGLDYSTYIDGPVIPNSSLGSVTGIATDSSGDAFVAGATSGTAFQTSVPGPGVGSAFVMELNPSGTAPYYSTLFGNEDEATGLAVDLNGQAVVSGLGTNLPVTTGVSCGSSPSPQTGGFVVKFTADGAGLVYLCGTNSYAASVAVDSTGAAYVAGVATPKPSTFQPTLLQPIQSYIPSGPAPVSPNVAMKFDISGNLQWSTFLGNNPEGTLSTSRIAVDSSGAAYILAESSIPPTPNSPDYGPRYIQENIPNTPVYTSLLKIAPSLGAPVPLIILPFNAVFPAESVGVASPPVDVQLANFGDAPMSPVISMTGDFFETDDCSAGVPGGQECDINVVFAPTAAGNLYGTLTVSFGGNIPPQTIGLDGDGLASGAAPAPGVVLSPTYLAFGPQANGTTSGAQTVTVTNSGALPLVISSVQVTSEFGTTNTCGAPIQPGSNCTIQVTFTPSASGNQNGTLTIADNVPNSPQTVALTGISQTSSPPPAIGLGVAPGGSASATVTAGASATYMLSIGGAGMSGTASLSCMGAPTGAACSVPATIPLSAAAASSFKVSVTTTASSNVLFYPGGPTPWLWALAILGCLALCKAAAAQPSGRLRWRLVPLLAVVLCACGGGSSTAPSPTPNPVPTTGTQAGTYTLTVTAKSGSTTQTQNLTLTVQ
jgi:hypothetical protein